MAKTPGIGIVNITIDQQGGSNAVGGLWIKNCTATETTTQEHANEFIEEKVLR